MLPAMPERYELVCRSPHGAVQRCRCCATTRVRFGSLLLRLDPAGLRQMCDVIAATRRGPSLPVSPSLPNVPPSGAPPPAEEFIFYLGESPLGFVLTRAGLEELDDLLQRACRATALLAWPDAPEPTLPRARRVPRRGGPYA